MRLFTCQSCGNTVFFENVRCTQCNHALAYLPDQRRVAAIEPVEGAENLYTALVKDKKAAGMQYKLCQNSVDHGVCNWAMRADDDNPLCESCRLNDVIPDLTDPKNLEAWRSLEVGKRRLFYTLTELGLPVESKEQRPNGMQFSFMADSGDQKVFTGHSDGLVTININEANDPLREKMRQDMGEGYRTVLGHFRHEIGHYYWDRLIKDSPWLNAYRQRFGDETLDYQQAVNNHYSNPPPSDWPLSYVSSYATMHPWEDWAETWAHYLHMVDTLGTSRAWGLVLKPRTADGETDAGVNARKLDFDDFDDLLRGWVPLTVALNSLNRSMGLIDPYPFVLADTVIEKLRFVHDVIEHSQADANTIARVAKSWEKKLPAAPVAEPVPQQQASAQ
ncbi:MAG: putative zinc-binding peptidase [Polyangiales bacterium]